MHTKEAGASHADKGGGGGSCGIGNSPGKSRSSPAANTGASVTQLPSRALGSSGSAAAAVSEASWPFTSPTLRFRLGVDILARSGNKRGRGWGVGGLGENYVSGWPQIEPSSKEVSFLQCWAARRREPGCVCVHAHTVAGGGGRRGAVYFLEALRGFSCCNCKVARNSAHFFILIN